MFCKKAVVKEISNIHRKTPLLESLFNSEYCEIFNSTYFEEHCERLLLKMCSWNWEKIEIVHKDFNFILKKQVKMFLFISWKKQVKMLVFISWLVSFVVCIQIQYFSDVVRNKLQTKNIYFRPVEMKKILGGAGCLLKNVGQLAKESRSIEIA